MSAAIRVVRHPRARSARLALDPATGDIRLTLPPRAALKPALAWAEAHRGWITAQQQRLPPARPFVPGAVIPYAGEDVTIEWRADLPRAPRHVESQLWCGGPREGLERRIERWLQRAALAVLTVETAEFARLADVSILRVGIGDARGRWGSCASSGAIRYSWRLILAPDWVRRATVAHEVAHRVHMNHGPDFHALVAQLLGTDPTPARRWLRTNGAALHWFGREPR